MKNKISIVQKVSLKIILILASVFVVIPCIRGEQLAETGSCDYDPFENAIPPDFGRDGTLLVLVYTYDAYKKNILDKVVPETYHGEYLITQSANINFNEIDSTKYRYILDKFSTSSGTHGASGSSAYTTSAYFSVYDRKTQKEYRYGYNGSAKKGLAKYLIALDLERLENTGK